MRYAQIVTADPIGKGWSGDKKYRVTDRSGTVICTNTLSSLPWAVPFGQVEVQVMLHQAEDILRWYDHMGSIIPTWYCTDKKETLP